MRANDFRNGGSRPPAAPALHGCRDRRLLGRGAMHGQEHRRHAARDVALAWSLRLVGGTTSVTALLDRPKIACGTRRSR